MSRKTSAWSAIRAMSTLVGVGLLVAAHASAQQIDIPGPVHSIAFGTAVAVLPNGNIVVTDPEYGPGKKKVGAVYLYSPRRTLISVLTGSTANDHVGNYGITLLANGNFVVSSPFWSNGKNSSAGAVTWVNGVTGLSGAVSIVNSLVGTKNGDGIGYDGVTALSNSNYVVASSYWNNGVIQWAGAATWANGNTGLTGVVSTSNSLVGTTAHDFVGAGGITPLSNGNYVVDSYFWNNGAATNAGAVTWISGNRGMAGAVSANNSLVGTSAYSFVGGGVIVELSNGNFVVRSRNWNNGSATSVGAVTWVNGSTGLTGPVSANNSLIGSTANDEVGGSGAIALNNGNYVVASPRWNNGASTQAGAVTWADGNIGLVGIVSASNSLVGSTFNDLIGDRVASLSNGNYVASSVYWDNGSIADVGAVTWGNGNSGVSGAVSASNSLIGAATSDDVGWVTTALSNGNYVVASPFFSNGAAQYVGAATWANGNSGLVGTVSTSNSLVGAAANDNVGVGGVAALSNGNYTVASAYFNDGATTSVGAVTWANGSTGLVGVVSPANSLIGSTANDNVGYSGVIPLNNGSYVVTSPNWDEGTIYNAGAATWVAGNMPSSGVVSAGNSLVGITSGHTLSMEGPDISGSFPFLLGTGDYLIVSPLFDNGSALRAGAISLGRRSGGVVGPVTAYNSVIGTIAGGGAQMVFAYDATRDTLVVGRPADNIVSLFKADLLFKNGFE